jgi:hypothetical protein
MPTNDKGATTDARAEPLQFDAAVHADPSAEATRCANCRSPIVDRYFAAGGAILCASCKSALERTLSAPATAGGMVRAVLFGLVAAVIGAAIYLGVLATGWEIALVAILVGWIVGWAVRRGAGTGGRRFQLLAVALTYLAIATAYAPVMLSMSTDKTSTASDSTSRSHAAAAASTTATTAHTVPDEHTGFGMSAFYILVAVVASPVVVIAKNFPSSILTLIIIGVGLRQAWRMNARVSIAISGPHQLGAARAATR